MKIYQILVLGFLSINALSAMDNEEKKLMGTGRFGSSFKRIEELRSEQAGIQESLALNVKEKVAAYCDIRKEIFKLRSCMEADKVEITIQKDLDALQALPDHQ